MPYILSFFLVLICFHHNIEGKIFDPIRASLKERIAQHYLPGVAMGLINPMDQVDTFVDGKISYDVNAPAITEETIFEIGSITKTFTGLLLLILEDEGLCHLDDPVTKHMKIALPTKNGVIITLRHLLNHRSGLPHIPDDLLKFSSFENPYENYQKDQFIQYLEKSTLSFTPGEKWEYCNNGMALLGMVLEHISKKPYTVLIQEKILKPLAMDHSHFAPSPSNMPIATPHFGDHPVPLWTIGIFEATGGLRSTVLDMLKYVKALITPDDKTSLGRAIKKSYESTYWTGKDNLGIVWIAHTGGTGGSRARIMVDFKGKRGGVILTNSALEQNVEFLYPALLGQQGEKILRELSFLPQPLSITELHSLEGEYKGDLGGIKVSKKNEKAVSLSCDEKNVPLLIELGGKEEIFYPLTSTLFFSKSTDKILKFKAQGELILGKIKSFSKEEFLKVKEQSPTMVYEALTDGIKDEDKKMLSEKYTKATFYNLKIFRRG